MKNSITLKFLVIKLIIVGVIFLIGALFLPDNIFTNVATSASTYVILLAVLLLLSYMFSSAIEDVLKETETERDEHKKDSDSAKQKYFDLINGGGAFRNDVLKTSNDRYKEKMLLYAEFIEDLHNYSVKEMNTSDEIQVRAKINTLIDKIKN